ncbi:protein spire isoform X2 [Sitophilus oryzae]|uniref:Protein spire isoform X2 n=1 Tax=Sitophilus oryzae TaxID=7048 RepID=A0A6J2X693_SITOR|nr:protein spire isoform X2 [Sitophilus oryzae]
MSEKSKCSVNSDGSVSLGDILHSFNSCIKEEHAWALCYQLSKYFFESLSTKKHHIHKITEVQHVFLKTDGSVHENTSLARDKPRELIRNEKVIVAGIGVVIYATLDHEFSEGEEVIISNELEDLISDMISDDLNSTHSHHETDDEGIERDSEESFEAGPSKSTRINLAEVIRRCETHLGTLTKAQVEAHYKAVVRALVAEAIELSTFLDKVAQGTISLPSCSTAGNLDELKFVDWAKFWVQVMGELRTGVKLKKVNYSKAPIEYELTPYEILMKDIRNCRYNLRKIMVNGDIPNRVSKDAHAIILDFIRSRPPLKKVSDRKLPPQSKTLTPREQLLLSIKKGRKLKPVPVPRACHRYNSVDKELPKPSGRKLIKVDFSQFEDDDDELTVDTPDSSEPGLWSSEYQEICDSTLDVYDLATQACNLNKRRSTLGVTETALGCYSVPQSRPGSRQSCNSTESESMPMEPEVARALQEELTNTQSWQDSISLDDRLSLTLSEIVHIRTVLTKAEVEALPTEGRVRHDVESRKVCFLCLKTRFGIFGPWGQRCTLCKRTVCTKCYSKVNIPMEHFSSVPVVLLSPSRMCTPEEETKETLTRSLINKMSSNPSSGGLSKDNSPDVSKSPSASIMESSVISDPGSVQSATNVSKFRTTASTVGRASRVVDRLKGTQMIMCLDCKIMVLQIIKSARVNRSAIRNKTLQTLTLNLSPVF